MSESTDQTRSQGSGEDREGLISIVLPVFEEPASVSQIVPKLVEWMAGRESRYEIVVVDDGSQDETLEVLRELQNQLPVLRIAKHLVNRGNGAALRTGIGVSRGDIVVTMDADGQHDPYEIDGLLAQIPPYDLVIGARLKDYRGPWHRNLANGFYNRFASWLTQRRIDDLTSGFRAFRRQAVLHFLHLFPEGFSAPTTTTLAFLKAGYNVTFVPVHVAERSAGESKIRLFRDGANFILTILRMIMLFDPLRIFLPIGLMLAVAGSASWALGAWRAGRLVLPNSAILLLIAALVTLLLGLVSNILSASLIYYHGDETIVVEEPNEQTR